MQKSFAILLILCLSVSLFAGCTGSNDDSSQQYVDVNGNIIATDSDDVTLDTFDEENEIKTDSSGNIINSSDTENSSVANSSNVTSQSENTVSNAGSSSSSQTESESDSADLPQIDINLTKKTVSDESYAQFDGSTLFISESGDYTLVGNFYGCVKVELDYNEIARLRLVGVNIVNTTGPAIQFINLTSDEENSTEANNPEDETTIDEDPEAEMNQPDAIISFIDGTTSELTVRDYSPNDMSGTIYSEVSLSIQGQGSGVIKNTNQNAIHCLKSIAIRNVNLTLSAPAGRGVYTKARYENNENATVKISAKRDAIKCDKFYMNSGTLIACSADNDGIDADDRAIISGGTLLADSGDIYNNYGIKVRRILKNEVRPDKYDTFAITGGTVLACGGYNTIPSDDTTTQCVSLLQASSYAKNNSFGIVDSAGNTVFAFAVKAARTSILVTNNQLTLGSGYSVLAGTTISSASSYNISDGVIIDSVTLYDGATASGGNSVAAMTFTSKICS